MGLLLHLASGSIVGGRSLMSQMIDTGSNLALTKKLGHNKRVVSVHSRVEGVSHV